MLFVVLGLLAQCLLISIAAIAAVQFGTGQRAVMLCNWEGNRRSGINNAHSVCANAF